MRITGVRVEVTEQPVKHIFRWRAGLPGSGTTRRAPVEIETDEGITGEARMTAGRIIADLVDRRLREMLVGRDPLMKEDLWERVWEIDRIEELPIYVLGLADIALWDITAKVAGLPLYKVIGGYRDRIPAYASTVTFETTEEFLDVADQCLELRFPRHQTPRLGRLPQGRQTLPGPAQTRRPRHRPDVRRLGRVRPRRGDLRRAGHWTRPTTSGTRSRCASSASTPTSGSAER